MASRKLEHLSERIRHKLGTILLQESNDPRFRHVTITGVTLSKDLSYARVTFSSYDALIPQQGGKAPRTAPAAKPKLTKRQKKAGSPEIVKLTDALNRASGFFAQAVARTLETRLSPKLNFVYDPTFDRNQEVENLLKPLRASGQMGPPEDADAAPLPDA